MKKKTLFSVLIISAFLLSGFAFAGFDPTPFKNQLGAVENILNSANNRVKKVLGYPPDPYEPSPNLNGAVNRLEAINKQLVSAGDMVFSIIEEVMGFDPSPFQEIIPELEAVRDVSQSIADEISTYLSAPPDSYISEFSVALEAVQYSAQELVNNVNDHLELPSDCSETCFEHRDPGTCDALPGCDWVYAPAGEGYCCDLTDPGS